MGIRDDFSNNSKDEDEGGHLASSEVNKGVDEKLDLPEVTSANKILRAFEISGKFTSMNFMKGHDQKSYMTITVIEKKQSPDISTNASEGKSPGNMKTNETDIIKLSCKLPMSQALTSTNAASWAGAETGSLGSLALQAITSTKANKREKEGDSEVTDRIKEKVVSGATSNLLGKQAENLRSFQNQSVSNNGKMMLFTGIDYRTFSFLHSFSPKNEDETKEVLALIKGLKYYSAPKYSPAVLTYPALFDVTFSKDFGLKLAPCALTNITVNYSPENIWASHRSGVPIHITLATTFQETELVFQDDIAAGDWY